MDKWLKNSNVVKAVAVLLAILLWSVVHMNDKAVPGSAASSLREESIQNVKVTAVNNPQQLSVVNIVPSEVTIWLKGKPSALKKISTNDNYKVEVDLSGLTAGEHYLNLKPLGFPTDVSVEAVPRVVKVELEEQQKKEVGVEINVTGAPTPGYKAGQPIVKPNRVLVTVPSHMLNEINVVKGDVSVDKATSTVTKQVRLYAVDKNGKEMKINISPAVVDVEVPITKPFKMIPLRLKVTGEPAKGFAVASLTQSLETITVYGPQEIIDKYEFYEGPAVDLTNLAVRKEYTLDIPMKEKLTGIEPSKVDIKIDIVPAVSKPFDGVPIRISGQNTTFDTSLAVPEGAKINVTLEGAPVNLDKLTLDGIEAFVDVSNIPPGRHEVPVQFNLPRFIKVIQSANLPSLKATVDIKAKTNP